MRETCLDSHRVKTLSQSVFLRKHFANETKPIWKPDLGGFAHWRGRCMEAREEGGRRQPEFSRPVVGTPSSCGLWLLRLCPHPGVPIPAQVELRAGGESLPPAPGMQARWACRGPASTGVGVGRWAGTGVPGGLAGPGSHAQITEQWAGVRCQ